MTRGSPPLTVSGTPIYFGPSALVVGSSTVPVASKSIPQMITTVAGQVITAAPNIVTIAGTTLTPGAPGITLDGTLLSLEKASQLVIGSKTISLQSASLDPIITTIGSQVITVTPRQDLHRRHRLNARGSQRHSGRLRQCLSTQPANSS